MAFTDEELTYLKSQPLARLATVGPDGQPEVVPVGFEYDWHLDGRPATHEEEFGPNRTVHPG